MKIERKNANAEPDSIAGNGRVFETNARPHNTKGPATRDKKKTRKFRSRIFNLFLLYGLVWLVINGQAFVGLSHMEKMLISYAMWGAIVFFTLGALLARQPTKIIALLSLLVLFSSQLGHFDPLTSGSMSADMVFFSAVMIFLSLLAHSIGIGAGLIVEAVTRRAFCFS